MLRTLLLATALLLIPLHALASADQTERKNLRPPRVTACTPVNPCAVPTPALGLPRPLSEFLQAQDGGPRQSRQGPPLGLSRLGGTELLGGGKG